MFPLGGRWRKTDGYSVHFFCAHRYPKRETSRCSGYQDRAPAGKFASQLFCFFHFIRPPVPPFPAPQKKFFFFVFCLFLKKFWGDKNPWPFLPKKRGPPPPPRARPHPL